MSNIIEVMAYQCPRCKALYEKDYQAEWCYNAADKVVKICNDVRPLRWYRIGRDKDRDHYAFVLSIMPSLQETCLDSYALARVLWEAEWFGKGPQYIKLAPHSTQYYIADSKSYTVVEFFKKSGGTYPMVYDEEWLKGVSEEKRGQFECMIRQCIEIKREQVRQELMDMPTDKMREDLEHHMLKEHFFAMPQWLPHFV